MKRFNVDSRLTKPGPSVAPWGPAGLLWRCLLGIAVIFGLSLLMKLLLSQPCDDSTDATEVYERPDVDPFGNPYAEDERADRYDPRTDPIADERFVDDPVPELPVPDDNYVRPADPDDIITDPDNPYRKIVGDRLNVIIDTKGQPADEAINRWAQRFKQAYPSPDYFVNYYNNMSGMLQITVPPGARARVMEEINGKIPDIDFIVFPEEVFETLKVVADHNDPGFSERDKSWGYDPIQAADAWEITKGSPDIVVAVIDSYIDTAHEEFAGRIVAPYNAPMRSNNPNPPSGPYSFENPADATIYHGTHVAGTAVAALDNGRGVSGIAPGCKLMPISVGGQITSMNLADAAMYAINRGANVINISIGLLIPEEAQPVPLDDQIEYLATNQAAEKVWDYIFNIADQRNITFVWAAGNCNVLSGMDETKRNDSTIRVSAVDRDLRKCDFSNFGNAPGYDFDYSDVSAPGLRIWSTGPGNRYGYCDGTSMAAPAVTGAVALMKSVNPNLTNAEIKRILRETGKAVRTENGEKVGPLIQVRDALLRAGGEDSGEKANFDDIKADPSNIIGMWRTTEKREVTDAATGEPKGFKCHVYLRFTSPTSGTIIYKEDTGNTYTAPITVKMTDDTITIKMTDSARSPNCEDSYVPNEIICTRGRDGTLVAHNRRSEDSHYYFIRVNS